MCVDRGRQAAEHDHRSDDRCRAPHDPPTEAREIACDRRVALGATLTRGLHADDTRRSDTLAEFWAGRGRAQDAHHPGSQVTSDDPETPGARAPTSRFLDLGSNPLVGGLGLALFLVQAREVGVLNWVHSGLLSAPALSAKPCSVAHAATCARVEA